MSASKDVRVRRWRKSDLSAIAACHRAAYPDYSSSSHYDDRIFELQLRAFPEGQYLVEVKGKVVAYATSMIVSIDDKAPAYRYDEITGAGTFSTHDPSGDTLYGADIAVHPDWRGKGIAAKLYVRRKALMKRHNLRRMIAYGRIPGYSAHSGKMTAEEYVAEVIAKKISDPALNAHLKAGYTVQRVLLDFVPDKSSLNFATLLELENPTYDAKRRAIASPPLVRPSRKVRVCAAQFMMRRIESQEEFEQTVTFFVDAAQAYHCHFLVLPELFTSQLLYVLDPDPADKNPMDTLAHYLPRYLELFKRLAQDYGLHIVGGTTPVRREDGRLYNVAHLFTPTGRVYTQDKLHVTPTERKEWGITPGRSMRLFETIFGRISIQVCYDIEFPELSRLFALAGAEVVFVPFSTDERKGYNRVRFSARARAVENYTYVVIAGNAGNLPSIKDYLINYAQSAVFTPSDFAFPMNAIAGEADPNSENVVIADLDLTTLEQQRELGSVRPFYDRRPDLYGLSPTIPIEVIRVE